MKPHPVAHAGATVALAGACVGGYLVTSGEATALPALTAGEAPLARMLPLERLLGSDSSASSRQASVTAPTSDGPTQSVTAAGASEAAGLGQQELGDSSRSARSEQQAQAAAAAEAARARQAQDAAAAQAASRAAEAERAAREAQRESVLANARKDPRAVARIMVAERGWNDAQFQCLDRLWQKESNWSYTARNRSSGAYGIPQSLPGSKMATAGPDWQTNPITQISWGLGYIKDRYGTPCNAWAHSVRTNWY